MNQISCYLLYLWLKLRALHSHRKIKLWNNGRINPGWSTRIGDPGRQIVTFTDKLKINWRKSKLCQCCQDSIGFEWYWTNRIMTAVASIIGSLAWRCGCRKKQRPWKCFFFKSSSSKCTDDINPPDSVNFEGKQRPLQATPQTHAAHGRFAA